MTGSLHSETAYTNENLVENKMELVEFSGIGKSSSMSLGEKISITIELFFVFMFLLSAYLIFRGIYYKFFALNKPQSVKYLKKGIIIFLVTSAIFAALAIYGEMQWRSNSLDLPPLNDTSN